jgi:hypothetical protein
VGVREMSLGISFSAVNLNQGGSMEGIPPDPTGAPLGVRAVPGQQ